MIVRPCGAIEWIASKIDLDNSALIVGGASESRCAGLPEWFSRNSLVPANASIFKIENPPSPNWNYAKLIRDSNLENIQKLLPTRQLNILNCDLLGSPSQYMTQVLSSVSGVQTVVLDISVLPKRVFVFLIKLLIPKVENLVVTYCSPESYPESQLCFSARPPEALPGFSQATAVNKAGHKVVVSLGFVPLSVGEIVGSGIGSNLEIIFPFPTSPDGYRRNWRLLSNLFNPEDLKDAQLRRIHALDAFEVCDLVAALAAIGPITAIPLGPKAHTLGMVLAALKGDKNPSSHPIQIIYPQPKEYLSNYSNGIKRTEDGAPSIFAYCLKKNGANVY
jgi:hypothetical protein